MSLNWFVDIVADPIFTVLCTLEMVLKATGRGGGQKEVAGVVAGSRRWGADASE